VKEKEQANQESANLKESPQQEPQEPLTEEDLVSIDSFKMKLANELEQQNEVEA
jgi:hypothetical protein